MANIWEVESGRYLLSHPEQLANGNDVMVRRRSLEVEWSLQFVLALGWMVFGLSLGAVFLLFYLLRRGAATSVASMFYLCPPLTAVLAWLVFGEVYTLWAAAGMVLAAAGVWLAVKT